LPLAAIKSSPPGSTQSLKKYPIAASFFSSLGTILVSEFTQLFTHTEVKIMPAPDMNRRLRSQVLTDDTAALNGVRTLPDYNPLRAEAALNTLQAAYQTMQDRQQAELELRVRFQSASTLARQAEWEFHNGVLAMRKAVLSQYGDDSNEVQTVGLKKKSARKRPIRRVAVSA
jgi:hypothetical protein